MRWRRIAFWLGISTLALVVLALTWLWTADLGVLKPQLERFVTEKTGREFAIDGDLSIDLARSSFVIAEDVRFQNADWADDADMVMVERIELRFDLWSLFSGPMIFELVDIDNADVKLMRPEDGDPNWVLALEERPEPTTPSEGLDLLIRKIDIDNVRLYFQSPERKRPLDLRIKAFRQHHRADGMLDVSVDAMLGGRVVSVDGELGTWDALLARKDVQFDVDAVIDTFELSGSGRIDDLASPVQPEIEFTAMGPDIDDLTQLLGLGDEGDGDINLIGSLKETAGGKLLLEINGNVGQSEIKSRGTASDLKNLRNIDFDLAASGPDLGRILRLFDIHQVREAPFTVWVDAKTEGKAFVINEASMVFGEAQIDIKGRMPGFPSLDDAVITLLLEGPDIARFRFVTGLPGAAEGPFRLGFTIDVTDEGVEVMQLDLETSLGELRAGGKLGDPPDYSSSQFEFQLNGESLERIASAYGIEGMPDYPIEIVGMAEYVEDGIRSIRPLTATVRQVSATIDGFVTLSRGVTGSDVAFTLKGPDFADLVGAFTNAPGVPRQAYEFRGRLQERADGFLFREVAGNVGSSSVTIDGLLTKRRGLGGTRFSFVAAGPAIEEIADELGELEIRPGPFELSGRIELQPDLIEFEDIELDRDAGHLSLDLGLGLPVSERRVKYDVRARGSDVRTLVAGIGPFMFKELPVSIDTRGELDGAYVRLENFDVTVGDAQAKTQGELELAEEGGKTELHWSGNIPSVARIATFNGSELRDQPVSWSADFVGGGGELRVDNLIARLGDSDVNGKVYFKAGDVPELSVNVVSESIAFVPFREKPEYEYESRPEFEDGKLIPDIPIPFDAMKKINASFEIDIKQLQRDALFMRNIEFDAHLRDGALEITKAGFAARSGAVVARARLEPVEHSGAASIELMARQFALGMVQANMDLAMSGDFDINIDSTGADLRTLLGNADGVFFMNARGGRVTNNRFIQAIYGDMLQEVLATINPFRKTDPYTDFKCIVVPLKFADGQVTSMPSAYVNTTKIRMVATPSVNLKTEKLRVTIRTSPERALGVSAAQFVNPFVRLKGTLAAPRLAVDEAGVLISGGAAVATGGLTLLARGLWDRLSRSRDPCKQSADQAIAELGDRFPDLVIEGLDRME